MKFGFLQVYNEAPWVGYQIDHAMEFCDHIHVIEGFRLAKYLPVPERSTDGTLEIVKDKMVEYRGQMTLEHTSLEHPGRANEAINFNLALEKCEVGDWFICLDADEFYSYPHIKWLNDTMECSDIDVIENYGRCFAFGFPWEIQFNGQEYNYKRNIFRKTKDMHFTPTHVVHNEGDSVAVCPYYDWFHYQWVKEPVRILTRLNTYGADKKKTEWAEKNWLELELEDGKEYDFYGGKFKLLRYEGEHPEILDNHPWRNIEDVRG